MSSVDNRIVKMGFDNKQFESGIKETMNSLNNLNKSLDMKGAGRGLDNLKQSVNGFSFSGMSNSVNEVSNRISAMSVIGITALANLTNSAINAGKNLLKSLTIGPITDGFREYETKMGAIQTILTNTAGGSKKLTANTSTAIKTAVGSASSGISEASRNAIEGIRKTQDGALKAFQKTADSQLEVVSDKYEKQLSELDKSNDLELRAFNKLQQEEMDSLDFKYSEQTRLLQESVDNEASKLKTAHEEKMGLYEEEYMAKLKVLDEERFNKIKAIDDEIKGINDKTKAEDEARKEAANAERLRSLQERLNNAKTEIDRTNAAKALIEFQEQLERDKVLKERKAAIDKLTESKQIIQEEYKVKMENLKTEYSEKQKLESEAYAESMKKLNDKYAEDLAGIKTNHAIDKELLEEKQYLEKMAFKELQDDKVKALRKIYSDEKTLLQEKLSDEKAAIKEKYDAEIDAINARNAASSGGGGVSVGGGTYEPPEMLPAATIDDVNKALAELNEYSDKTIYNFAQMTDNIGKMTAAGLGLEDSVTVVKGMANTAAGFGVDATRMAGATYQMSQALSAGVIKLQDWKSLEQSGMGGSMLQDTLYKTAEEMGVFVDKSIPFRESLESGWLSSAVFVGAMDKMAKDPSLLAAATNVTSLTKLVGVMQEQVASGWTETWENIFGNKDESTKLFTGISNQFGKIAGAMADYRNESLEFWKANGGREAILKGLANIMTTIGRILGPIYDAYIKIIDPWNGERLVDMSKGFESLTEKLTISETVSNAIGKTFEGLFTIIKGAIGLLAPIGVAIEAMIIIAKPFIDAFVTMAGSIGGWVTEMTKVADASGLVSSIFGYIIEGATALASSLDYLLKNGLDSFGERMEKIGEFVDTFATKILKLNKSSADGVTEAQLFASRMGIAYTPLEKISLAVKGALSTIQNALDSLVTYIKTKTAPITDFFKGLIDKLGELNIQGIDFINAGIFASLIIIIKKVIPMIAQFLKTVGSFKTSMIDTLEALQDTMESYQKNLKADTIKKIATAMLLLAGAIMILSLVNPDRLIPAVAALSVLMAGIMAAMWGFGKIDLQEFPKVMSSVVAMIGIAISLNILASALNKLATLKWEEIGRALAAFAVTCIGLVGVVKTIDGVNIGPKQGIAIMQIAQSLLLFSLSFSLMAKIPVEDLEKGLKTMALVFTGVSVFINSLRGVKNMTQAGAGMLVIATSMLIVAGALSIFGNMNVSTLTQGMVVMGLALAQFSILMNSFKGLTSDAAGIAKSILTVSIALIVMAGAIAIFGNMDIGTIAQGMISIGLLMTVLAGTLHAMPKNTESRAAGLIALGIALTTFSLAIKALGSMDTGTLIQGILGMASALLVLGGLTQLLKTTIPFMLGLAVGIGALAISIGLVGGSLILLSIGLTSVGGSIVALLGGVTIGLTSLLALIPMLAATIALALVSFVSVIGYNAPAIQRAFSALIKAALNVVIENIPVLAELLLKLLLELVKIIKVAIPEMVDAIGEIIMAVLTSIDKWLPKLFSIIGKGLEFIMEMLEKFVPRLIKLAIDSIDQLIEGVIKTLKDNTLLLIKAIVEVFEAVMKAVFVEMPKIVVEVMKSLVNLWIDVLKNLAEAIPKIITAIGDIITGILKAIGDNTLKVVNAMAQLVIDLINGFAAAIETNGPEIRKAVKRLIKAITDEIVASVGDIKTAAGHLIGGFVSGIWDGLKSVTEAAKGIASAAVGKVKEVLGIHSPSRVFYGIAKFLIQGLSNGLVDYKKMAVGEAGSVAGDVIDVMKTVMSTINDVISSDIPDQPVIRPVLDLTNIQNGYNAIGSMFDEDINARTKALLNVDPSRVKNGSNAESQLDKIASKIIDGLNQKMKGVGDTNITLISPTPLSPSETARQTKKAMQELALGM